MNKTAVSAIMLTLLLIGILSVVFDVQPAKSGESVQLLLKTDKSIYGLGQNVTITLLNVGNETAYIGGYPAWQIFTYPEKEPAYPEIFAYLAWQLEPGENDTFTWNQYNEFDESYVEPGNYVIEDNQGWGLSAYFNITDVLSPPQYSAPAIEWNRTYGGTADDVAYNVELTNDGARAQGEGSPAN